MKTKLLLTFTAFLFLTAPGICWEKNVLVSPLRILIDSKQRTDSVQIVNTSESETTYRISLVSMNTDIYGSQKENNSPAGNEAKALEILKFSPKRTTLSPGRTQTIRLFAKRPFDLEAGEYRTHLKITPLPPPPEKKPGTQDKGLSIKLNFLVSTTIPVIIRHGDTYSSVNIEKAEIKENVLSLSLSRAGNASALFNIEVYNSQKLSGERNRNAFYTPNNEMITQVNLDKIPQKGDRLDIFIKNAENGNNFTYDVSSITVK